MWAAATVAVGAVMLFRPHAVARLASGTGSIPDAAVVRILGGRQLLQGTVLVLSPAPLLVVGGLAVDGLHAASMVAAAVIWPGYRQAALAQRRGCRHLRRGRRPDPSQSAASG